MYLLDTDVLIWILRGKKDVIRSVTEMKEKHDLAISVISVAEIYKNIFPSELMPVTAFLEEHIILDVNIEIAKTSGLYFQQYGKKLKSLSLTDCLIAASARIHEATLVTYNTKHFPMRDISVQKP